eukprot:1613107-Rhodomonas_salina.2
MPFWHRLYGGCGERPLIWRRGEQDKATVGDAAGVQRLLSLNAGHGPLLCTDSAAVNGPALSHRGQ